ncbi:TPA: hypothetical protein MAQ95_003395 [Klebsiella pneumoniae]|uniref:Uncharacterized protein n=1 Tax=Klebsiella pneumoniae TaxID=573 RepID=A0A939SSF0_KLEPN|nr:hypothetical protein [Klebsiella pneumoniae]HBS7474360.1 hypothetical protein [Klebsiella pneumoniae]HBU2189698.1 hypothetical protein [Klebsiella pneumoniae]HBV9586921.1 hypothetical protein [Klebsiella pneumoniae]HCT6575442.1 hypothetical protein [Klebsiella pneumoniae]
MEGNSLIFNSEIIRDWSGFANPNCHRVLGEERSALSISVKISKYLSIRLYLLGF